MELARTRLSISPTPTAHFGAGTIESLGAVVSAMGCPASVIITDKGLAGTPVVGAVLAALDAAGLAVEVFSGVHANPTTHDIAAGADAVAGLSARVALVAVGGGSSIDAAKGIALAAVNPQRGRDLDYRSEFAVPALPIVAIPTTAGTGAETNSFGVVTDPDSRRKFYVGHASTMPAAAILDPELTVGLPTATTAATGLDVLTHAIESYLSVRANPWADAIALGVIKMVSDNLPRACSDGADLEARAAMLLAAHMAGIGMATTGLGLVHAIGHALGGRYDLAHGASLAVVLPDVLRFSVAARGDKIAATAFALGVGRGDRDYAWNAAAAIDAVAALRAEIGLAGLAAAIEASATDLDAITAAALDDEVLANAPRQPSAAQIGQILAAAGLQPT
jgi:alcohol dehydrogenase